MTKKKPMVNGKPVYNPWNEGYGAKVPNWLLRREEPSHGAKLVYARLVQYGGKNGVAYPYVQTLATEIGMKRRQAERYLKELRDLGLLEVKSGKEAGKRSRYFFVNHAWKDEAAGEVNLGAGLDEVLEDFCEEGEEGPSDTTEGGLSDATEGVRQDGRREVRQNGRTGSVKTDGLNIIQGKQSENVLQRNGADADAPPSLSPEPKGATLAPGLGSYSEKAAREPDAEHEFDAGNGQASLEDLKARVGREAAKRAEVQLAKEKKRAQAKENLASDGKNGSSPTQKQALKQLESTWAAEMGKRFPDLAIASWDAKNRGQARNLITKYDGGSADAAVKYVVRRWEEFNKSYFKGTGTIPTIGMILKLHETIVPVAVQWEKHADTMEKWEKFYAEHPYDDPPADLEKKYRAAKASLNALGLA